MGRLMISSSQMCISREQEEFLAAYRTDEARQAFIDSYGKEKVNFFDCGYGENSNKPFDGVLLEYFSYFARNGVCWFDLDVDVNNPNLSIHLGFRVNEVLSIHTYLYLFGYTDFQNNRSPYKYNIMNANADMFSLLPNVYDTATIYVSVPEGILFKYFDVVLNNPLHTAIFNDKTYYGELSSNNTGSGSLTLFVNVPNRSLSCDVFYLRIYNASNLIRDFIPILDNDVVALYDLVSHRVFNYQGTGFFTPGPLK